MRYVAGVGRAAAPNAGDMFRLLVALLFVASAVAFAPRAARPHRAAALNMGLFDGFKDAFKNDETLRPQEKYGDKNKVVVTFQPGNKQVQAVAGQQMKEVVRAGRMNVKYNCSKGECGTCEILVDGRKARACTTRLPAKPAVTIKAK